MNVKPIPEINEFNQTYFDAAKENKLVIQYCDACQKYIVYPRNICPSCLSKSYIKWREVSGEAELYTFAEVHRPQHKSLLNEVPIFLAAVKLKEGPIMISRIVDCQASDLEIGIKLQVKGYPVNDDILIPVFTPNT